MFWYFIRISIIRFFVFCIMSFSCHSLFICFLSCHFRLSYFFYLSLLFLRPFPAPRSILSQSLSFFLALDCHQHLPHTFFTPFWNLLLGQIFLIDDPFSMEKSKIVLALLLQHKDQMLAWNSRQFGEWTVTGPISHLSSIIKACHSVGSCHFLQKMDIAIFEIEVI